MKVYQADLKLLTTFRMGGRGHIYEMYSNDDIEKFFTAHNRAHILGSGSNILVNDKVISTPFVRIMIDTIQIENEDNESVFVRVGAGMIWDDFVKWSTENKYSGIELLSGIPGTVGASPIQNIGAYGQEVKDCIVSVTTFDSIERKWDEISNDKCNFGYRKSIFQKGNVGENKCVVYVTYKLSKALPLTPKYSSLVDYIDENNIPISLDGIRSSVISVRSKRLPDPKDIASVGSFFKNVIITKEKGDDIKNKYPTIPLHNQGDEKVKVSTGYLVEYACKDTYECGRLCLFEGNRLVVVNKGEATLEDIYKYKNIIVEKVKEKFGLDIEMEPSIIEN